MTIDKTQDTEEGLILMTRKKFLKFEKARDKTQKKERIKNLQEEIARAKRTMQEQKEIIVNVRKEIKKDYGYSIRSYEDYIKEDRNMAKEHNWKPIENKDSLEVLK